jgi:pyruvate,water dikinase
MHELTPQDLAKSFYFHAYFNMDVIAQLFDRFGMPREGLELLMGYQPSAKKLSFKPSLSLSLVRALPRLFYFILKKLFISRNLEQFLTFHGEQLRQFDLNQISTSDAVQILQSITELHILNKSTAYYVIVTQLLHGVYMTLLRHLLQKKDINVEHVAFPTETYSDVLPTYALQQLHEEYLHLPSSLKQQFKALSYIQLSNDPHFGPLKQSIDDFLMKFGHLSDQGNDFSRIPWRESPDLVLSLLLNYGESKGNTRSQNRIQSIFRGLFNGFWIKRVYGLAHQFQEYKERVGYSWTRSYGLFRPCFRRLGEIFVERGYFEDVDDIFFLTYDEIRDVVALQQMPEDYAEAYLQRKKAMRECVDLKLPPIIFGDDAPPLASQSAISQELQGIAASTGYAQGPIRVITSVKHFDKVQKGDIIVIPYSDISWTPIFTKAAAIVSESGGLLSHAAVVAREYEIPAIVGVANACKLSDDVLVFVDGHLGIVSLTKKPPVLTQNKPMIDSFSRQQSYS